MAVRIDPDSLRSLGSDTSYERGLEYANQGRVGAISQQGQVVRATVMGSQPYPVRLDFNGDTLEGHCACPVGSEEVFCKHCVALAIVWSAHGPDYHIQTSEPADEPTIEEAALALSHDELVDLVTGAAERNPALAAELLARAGMLPEPGTPAVAVMRARVASVLPDEPVDNWDAWFDIPTLLDELTDLVRSACSDDVVVLVEDAMRRWETATETISYEAPEADELWKRLAELHHEACRLARPDPAILAHRLLGLHLHLGGTFDLDVPGGYAGVLGDEGVAAFQAEVRRRFAELPPVRPGDLPAYEHGRTALTDLAVDLAEDTGDVDQLVDTLAKNLGSSGTYVRIAEALRCAGRDEEALRWARDGLAAYDDRIDVDLLDIALAIHEVKGHDEDAREEARQAFRADPRLETYQRMAARCRALPGWADERDAAVEAVRRAVERPGQHAALHRGILIHLPQDHELVRLFLWDGDDEAAWREACTSQRPLHDRLWLEVAEHRARTHPLDAARVYQKQIERDIEYRRNETYAKAADKIRRIGELMTDAGHREHFAAYAAEIRRIHARKRNLMAAMDAAGLP